MKISEEIEAKINEVESFENCQLSPLWNDGYISGLRKAKKIVVAKPGSLDSLVRICNAITEACREMQRCPDDSVQDIVNESLDSWETGLRMDHNFNIDPNAGREASTYRHGGFRDKRNKEETK